MGSLQFGLMYYELFAQKKKMLGQMSKWLEAATAHAKEKSFDPNVFLSLRLVADQFPLSRQVQSACDTAKLGAARLSGKTPPSHPDDEKTLDDLRERIKSTIAYLDTFTGKDFEGADTRVVTQPRWEGKVMTGAHYFAEHVVPNFYFHTAHTYAILRHNGVNIGKRDYLGTLTMRAP